jgi:Tol biopolymer transport system component
MARANPPVSRAEQPAPSGEGPRAALPVAPALSVVGLVVIAAASFVLIGGSLPSILPGGGPGGPISGPGGPVRTATPSNVVVVDPRTQVPGTLLYAKDGNIWAQSGDQARQVTSSDDATDSMPTWSPDGSSVYFVRTVNATGTWVTLGVTRTYNLQIPSLLSVPADGSADPTLILRGRIRSGNNTWSYFIREPAISPDGTTAALITDGPDPTRSDIVLKLLNLQSKKLTDPGLPESDGLGHQDPAWSPDGKALLYVKNAREGSRGTPQIMRYNVATGRAATLTTGGYTAPSWSRDGRFVAATKTSSFGTDVVILDARNGTELLKLTNDELSFSPVWSPRMDAVAFFKLDHGVVDLWLIPLTGTGPSWTVGQPIALTIAAGLDARSRPQWFIPADQLPPLPTPTPGPSNAGPEASPTTSP